MVATDQENEQPEGGEGTEPEPTQPEGNEPQEGLINEVTKQRAQKREATERAEKAEAELAKAQEQLKELEQQGGSQNQEAGDISLLAKEVAELRANEHRRDISRQLNLGEKQAAAIVKLMGEMPKLNLDDAYHLAKHQDKELFESQEGSGFDPSQHGSLGTTRGAPPLPDEDNDFKERLVEIKKLESTDQLKADALRNNTIGQLAAEAMGLRHHKIPLK